MPVTIDRDEHIADITVTENSVLKLPGSGALDNQRFMSGIQLMFEGRITTPGATHNPSAVLADNIAGFFERIRVYGYHRGRRQDEMFVDVRGSDLYEFNRLYHGSAPLLSGTLVTTASTSVDVRLELWVPFTPENIPYRQRINYLLDTPNYLNPILEIQTGDYKSMYTAGDQACTWTSYGKATGSPRIRVTGFYAMDPSKFAGFIPGRQFLLSSEVSGSLMTTSATNVRLFEPPKGRRLRSLLLKTGAKSTGTTSPNNAFVTLSDDILTNLRFNVGLEHPIRKIADFRTARGPIRKQYGISPSTGYCLLDFAKQGSLNDMLDTRGYISGPTGDVDVYLAADVSGASDQALSVLVSEIRYTPSRVKAAA